MYLHREVSVFIYARQGQDTFTATIFLFSQEEKRVLPCEPLSANVPAALMGQPHILQCKTNAPRRTVKTLLNFKIMTHVMNIFDSSLNSNRKLKYFSVEVITFDGDSYTIEVEARNAEEAQEIAASQVEDADYTMVQGCFAGW